MQSAKPTLHFGLLASVAVALAACGGSHEETVGPQASTPVTEGPAQVAHPPATTPAPAPAVVPPTAALPALPLRTDSRWIVDANGRRFKLASVNWYGAEAKDFVVAGLDVAKLADVAAFIKKSGFNSVRLPWSNELYETNPVVNSARLAANPALQGKHGLEVLDAVIDALAMEGLVVVLDNHVSHADWCCNAQDGNGLWFTDAYPESSWLADWTGIVKRYKSRPAVVAADLRNELRAMPDGRTPTWGGSDPALDWRAAAMRGGDAVLAANPKLLVVIEGLEYATDLSGAYDKPATLAIPNRLVYSAHDYAWFHNGLKSEADLHTALGNKWGFLVAQGKPYTAPVWIGEFGTKHDAANVDAAAGQGLWFKSFRRYLADADLDWSYWALNGTQATGTTRTLGAEENFGIMNKAWTTEALKLHLDALTTLAPATQGPK